MPVVDLNGAAAGNDFTATFTENGPAVAVIAATAAVTRDPVSNLSGATFVLTDRPNGAAESLSIDVGASGLISSGYNSTTGTLTISGNASLAVYESVLRTLAYHNTSDGPGSTPRVIEVTVQDATNPASSSLVRLSTISIAEVNDGPVNVVPLGTQTATANSPLVLSGANKIAVTDPDAAANPVRVTLTATHGSSSPSTASAA